ncbi:invasion associated locus B family protein [Roseomonas sp. HJA6]|uniref:Invasion associated locus B family protein n=2 Tax=Roseomonas alba TaxID=2846776 RepID=A0ABS7A6W7_9PROT|nr:invasion associated locus B family protein [Neoroseomonas alba]MBW6397055.1 invasion associated locus B family protein [Neoroseomonas alba]
MQRVLLISALAALFVVPAVAQNSPRRLGEFGQWTAAVHQEQGQKLCYAFTRASRMSHARTDVMLMVTHRGRTRNEVALAAGYIYPRNARVTVSVGREALPFQADGTAAFARDSQAAVAAFRRGSEAIARGPRRAGRSGTVTDTFSLRGFTAAYNAITRECPPRRGRR